MGAVEYYDVQSDGPTVGSLHHVLFETQKQEHPMCSLLSREGFSTDGCERAAAFTTWNVRPKRAILEPYDPVTGKKTPPDMANIRVRARVVLPRWNQLRDASKLHRQEATRACMRTAYHEAGHMSTAHAVAEAIHRFVAALPARVAPAVVPVMNLAVQEVVRQFYIKQARVSDDLYDTLSRHGLIQGAVFDRALRPQGEPRHKYESLRDARVAREQKL